MRAKIVLSCAAAALCAYAGASADAVWAHARSLAMLDRLVPGDWEMRHHDSSVPVHMCLRDARRLIQLRHEGQNCTRVVVDDTDTQVTVQYTCQGHGYGRTQIRRESDSLIQLDSQGIADGRPFAFSAEARRVGRCR